MTDTVNIEIDQGATKTIQFIYDDISTGLPIDLSGYTAKMQVRDMAGTTVLLDFSTANGKLTLGGSDGLVRILLAPIDTTVFTTVPEWRRGVYDVYLTKTSDGTVTRLVKGLFLILPRITQ